MTETQQLVEHRFPAATNQLREVRCRVRAAARRFGFSIETINAIVLAVDEACTNIIRHGYGHDVTGEIILEILATNNTIVFRLTDFAEPVDPKAIKPRNLEDVRPGGLGMHFIRDVMDAVEYVKPPAGVGNILEMRKSTAPS